MKKLAPKNVSASVHQRLLNLATDTGTSFNEVLLFRVWIVPDSRATCELDFLVYLDNSPETLATNFLEVCASGSGDCLERPDQ